MDQRVGGDAGRAKSNRRSSTGDLAPASDCRGLFEFILEDLDESFDNAVVEDSALIVGDLHLPHRSPRGRGTPYTFARLKLDRKALAETMAQAGWVPLAEE